MTSYANRLHQAVRAKKTAALVGLDPRFRDLPAPIVRSAQKREIRDPRALAAAAYEEFCFRLIDVVAPLVPAVKPQSAFFEECGPEGVRTLARVIRRAREAGLIVICDAKRGDIGSTAEAYAAAYLAGEDPDAAPFAADALTVNPYLGEDTLDPFVRLAARARRGGLRARAHEQFGGRRVSGSRRRFAAALPHVAGVGRGAGRLDGREPTRMVRSARSSGRPSRASCGSCAARCRMRPCLCRASAAREARRPTSPGPSTKMASGRSSTMPAGINFAHAREPYRGTFRRREWEQAVEAATKEMIAELAATHRPANSAEFFVLRLAFGLTPLWLTGRSAARHNRSHSPALAPSLERPP